MTFPEKSVEKRARALFGGQGVSARSGLDDTCDEILSLMQQRQDDPSFWPPLTDLLRAVVRNAITSGESGWRTVPQAQLLAAWDADELAEKLREALREEDSSQDRRTGWARFAGGLPPAALTAFLLLGLAAAGCSDSADPILDAAGSSGAGGAAGAGGNVAGSGGSGGQTAGAGGNVAGSGGSGGQTAGAGGNVAGAGGAGGATQNPTPDGSVEAGTDANADVVVGGDAAADVPDAPKVCTSELYQIIQDASLTEAQKQAVYTCIINLRSSWCDGLVDLFATRTPSQIAGILNTLTACCQSMPSRLSGEYTTTTQNSVINGMLCAVPLYRGVAFPD
jgi:hypothetical protein